MSTHSSTDDRTTASTNSSTSAPPTTIATPITKTVKANLFDYTEDELLHEQVLTHYELLNVPPHASQDDVKKAYRRASLKYHPDKTGRGEEDYVFLAIKAAYDVLFDPVKRQAYDSTTIPFDDSIPSGQNQYYATFEEFEEVFQPVFERNLRFDARLRPEQQQSSSLNKNGTNNKKKSGTISYNSTPTIGTATSTLEEIHAFYDYWTRFESWRDFSATAAEELQVENIEDVESRYEKRWLQKEVDKRAKVLKRKEMARIQSLVERAMELDPRLRQERAARQAAKEEAARQKELEKVAAEQRALEQQKAEAERLELERQQKALEKIEREKEKKLVRKERQSLRRMTSASFEEVSEEAAALWKDSYDMSQDVDLLCTSLSLEDLKQLNKELEEKREAAEALKLIHARVSKVKSSESQQQQQDAAAAEKEDEKKSEDLAAAAANTTAGPLPWSKEEISALAKGVKKYPPGGASRWDQIALFVNNLCKQDNPRSKQECIDKYNAIARNATTTTTETPATTTAASSSTKAATIPKNAATAETAATAPATPTEVKATDATTTSPAAATKEDSNSDVWTIEQDQQLQAGLAQHPANMDKNERWTRIAKGVTGKTKKQCVQRFKEIRDVLKSRK